MQNSKLALINPLKGNQWNRGKTKATISPDGMNASYQRGWLMGWIFPTKWQWQYIFAAKGFPISGEHFPMEQFAGTIAYYFEVTKMSPSTK
jgi:hypothetical protein